MTRKSTFHVGSSWTLAYSKADIKQTVNYTRGGVATVKEIRATKKANQATW